MDLRKQGLELIPVEDLEITSDPGKTIGYDLTVEDYFTFCTNDGVFIMDTMAIFHPITNEAQEEVKKKMTRATSGTSTREISFGISKEMAVGVYFMTKDAPMKKSPIAVSEEDLQNASDPYIPVVYKGRNTTMGKAIFNSCLPQNHPFVDQVATKGMVNSLASDIVTKYGEQPSRDFMNKLKVYAFKFATIGGSSITLDQIELPASIYKIKKKLKGASTEEAVALLAEAQKLLIEHLKGKGLHDIVSSGSAKGWSQPMMILVAKGIIADPKGNILPVLEGSFADGLTPKEYFSASAGSRKGIIDRVINTADTGYMSRKLAFVLNSVEADLKLNDCKTTKSLKLKLTKDLVTRLDGRFVTNDKGTSVKEISPSSLKVGEIINLRSPIFCKSNKVCHTCYGKLLARHKSPYIGIVAAQIIGQVGTQLIMRTFHTGGAVTIKRRDILQEIINNDPMINMKK